MVPVCIYFGVSSQQLLSLNRVGCMESWRRLLHFSCCVIASACENGVLAMVVMSPSAFDIMTIILVRGEQSLINRMRPSSRQRSEVKTALVMKLLAHRWQPTWSHNLHSCGRSLSTTKYFPDLRSAEPKTSQSSASLASTGAVSRCIRL